VYLAAALAMGAYYDAVYGAGPVTHHTLLLRVGVAGTFLFGCTFLLSLWKPHRAVLVGILACCLCWSDFARIVPQIPFLQVFSAIGVRILERDAARTSDPDLGQRLLTSAELADIQPSQFLNDWRNIAFALTIRF